jgi:hypothetical protein
VTKVAAAARRTLAAGSARIRRTLGYGDEAGAVHEGVADIARRRVAFGPRLVYGDGAMRHRASDGEWAIFTRRPGQGDPLSILDSLTTASSAPVVGEEDVRGVPCERVDFFATDERLAQGRAWIGPDDRLRRVRWTTPGGLAADVELWDFGLPVQIQVPDAKRRGRRWLAGALVRGVLGRGR